MMESLVFFVLVAAILIIFLHDISGLIKKLLSLPGVAWLLPLVLATTALVTWEPFWRSAILEVQVHILAIIYFIESILPFTKGAQWVACYIVLISFSLLPMIAMYIWNKRRQFQQIHMIWGYGLIIFILSSVLLVEGLYL